MKRRFCLVLILALCIACSFSAAEEPESLWTYRVSLRTVISPYVMLVNADNLLDKSYVPENRVKVTGVKRATSADIYMVEIAADALKEMFEAAAQVTEYTYQTENGTEQLATFENGMILYIKSGYRSYGTQATTYANYLARNNNIDDGYSAKPGASDHQTGLCADILNADYAERNRMTPDFQWTPEAQWMKEHCAEYGFVLRFPDGKLDVTGIQFEPWHFRYVGLEAAGYIMSADLTLEEFDAERKAKLEAFLAAGGNEEDQIAYEISRQDAPPESDVLDVLDEDGDPEVSLKF